MQYQQGQTDTAAQRGKRRKDNCDIAEVEPDIRYSSDVLVGRLFCLRHADEQLRHSYTHLPKNILDVRLPQDTSWTYGKQALYMIIKVYDVGKWIILVP